MDQEKREVPVRPESQEISLKELILRIKSMLLYVLKKWMVVAVFVIIGAALAFFVAKSKKPRYMAQSIFVLDEGKKGATAIGGLALLGLDMGGGSAGLFTGTKNIIWLYSSKPMIKGALMSPVVRNGRKQPLVSWFLEESKLDKKLKASLLLQVTDTSALTPEQNAIMDACYGVVAQKYLVVKEQEGTENMIKVSVTSSDELFSKTFAEVLVNTVNRFYIQSKTLKIAEEVAVLQQKADSVKSRMDASMYQAASAVDAAPFANPNMQVLRVAPQRKRIDVEVASNLYVELVKNLESRKMAMAQETPLIQVIDTPSLPLDVIQPSPVTYGVLGGFVGGLICVLALVCSFFYKKVMAG